MNLIYQNQSLLISALANFNFIRFMNHLELSITNSLKNDCIYINMFISMNLYYKYLTFLFGLTCYNKTKAASYSEITVSAIQ